MVGTMAFAFSNIDLAMMGVVDASMAAGFIASVSQDWLTYLMSVTRRLSFDVLSLLLSICRFDFDMHTLSPTCAGGFLLQWFVDTLFLISYRCWS